MHPADTRAAVLVARLPADVGAVVVRHGDAAVVAAAPVEVVAASATDAFASLDRLTPGWWAGFLAYELGHAVERVAPSAASREVAAVPDVLLARFEARAVVTPDGVAVEGGGDGRPLLEAAARSTEVAEATEVASLPPAASRASWRSSLDRDEYEARVATVLELLGAGECYQVNLTRRLTSDSAVDPVALFGALTRANPAPHAALLRLAVAGREIAVVSASPERFLRWDDGNVETRPIKGTSADEWRLRQSAKDRAENVMIVDLARNDLGRVCEPGSITVPALCAVETHPGLHHLVSTVRGTLRDDVGLGALVRATFPPASVTGAPKPRVLQVIEELEPVRRGVYCGALGWIDTERHRGDLAVAIRTFTVVDDSTQLGVGGGIVADSRPGAEWEETELKAARLLEIAGTGALVGAP